MVRLRCIGNGVITTLVERSGNKVIRSGIKATTNLIIPARDPKSPAGQANEAVSCPLQFLISKVHENVAAVAGANTGFPKGDGVGVGGWHNCTKVLKYGAFALMRATFLPSL